MGIAMRDKPDEYLATLTQPLPDSKQPRSLTNAELSMMDKALEAGTTLEYEMQDAKQPLPEPVAGFEYYSPTLEAVRKCAERCAEAHEARQNLEKAIRGEA